MDKKAFFKSVGQRAGCDEHRAEGLTFAVFQELRDRLTPSEVADVDAQLPAALKPLWEFLDRPGRHVRKIHEPQFVGEVRLIASLPDEVEAERAVVAVFATLQELLGSPTGMEGEAWHVMSQLPEDLRSSGSALISAWRVSADLTRRVAREAFCPSCAGANSLRSGFPKRSESRRHDFSGVTERTRRTT